MGASAPRGSAALRNGASSGSNALGGAPFAHTRVCPLYCTAPANTKLPLLPPRPMPPPPAAAGRAARAGALDSAQAIAGARRK